MSVDSLLSAFYVESRINIEYQVEDALLDTHPLLGVLSAAFWQTLA